MKLRHLGALLPLLTLWASCYVAHLLPWPDRDEHGIAPLVWWCGPFLLTSLGLGGGGLIGALWCLRDFPGTPFYDPSANPKDLE